MQNKTLVLAAAASATLSSFPAGSLAEDDTASWRGDEIVVTARKQSPYGANEAAVSRMPVPLEQIPQSIQVLTPALLEEQELSNLAAALLNVSGVVPSQPSEIVLSNPVVRGFEAELFVDGLLGYGDTAVADPASLIGVERIEVAKGPTSVLFGGGTGAPVGGLINVVTKAPEADAFATLALRTGSFATFAPSVDINLPLGQRAGFRLPAEYHRSDDYVDEVEIERWSLNPSLGVAISAATDALFRVGYNRIEQLEYVGIPAAVVDVDGVDAFQFTSAADAPDTVIENLTMHATLTHRFSDSLSGTFQLRRFENSFDEFSSSPFFAFFPLVDTAAPQIRGSLPVDTTEWTADASVTAAFRAIGAQHTLLAGLTWDDTNYVGATGFDLFTPLGPYDYLTETPRLSFGEVPPLTTFLESDYRTIALYVQDHIRFGERTSLLIGARASRYELVERQGGQGTDETFDRVDPRVGVTIEMVPGLSAFAGWSTGSRLSLFFASADGSPPELETSESVEAGLKFHRDDIGLSGTVAGFRILRENVPTPDPGSFVTSIQTGEQEAVGVEMDLIWEPVAALSVLLTAAYTDSEVTRDTVIPEGAGIPRVPDYSGRVAARYRFSGRLEGLGVGAGLTWAAPAELTLPNSFESDAYSVIDLQASYSFGRYRLGLTIENLADEDYFRPYQYFAQAVVRPGMPRAAFVTLSADL